MKLALLAVVVIGAGCSPPRQVLTGQVGRGFPSDVTMITISTPDIQSWKGNAVVASGPVMADGSFRLEVDALPNLHLHLVGADASRVVFPRQAGSIDRVFSIRASGPDFDFGMISFVGAASTTPFVFKSSGMIDCNDGHDANGNMCVDDDDEHGDSCDEGDGQNEDGQNEDGQNEDGQNEDGQHEDGQNEDGDDDGDHHGQHEDDDDDGGGLGDSVAEHTFPSDGCNGDQGDDEGDD